MNDLITLKPGAEIIGFDDWKNKVYLMESEDLMQRYFSKGKTIVGWVILFL